MPSPSPYTKRRSVAATPSVSPRSKGGFFYKSVLFALFLLALPLFPSQAPEFVGETVPTKLWELIHLLFVGITVAYGLFSRRSVESSLDSRMKSGAVDESSLSDESRLIHVSARASVAERESESFNQVQAWNSQCYQGRSKVVVVARPAYGLDGHVVHQPLGLPVRSLMSALRDNAAHEDSSCLQLQCRTIQSFPALSQVPNTGNKDKIPRKLALSLILRTDSHLLVLFLKSLNSNVDEPVKEKSLECSSRSSSLSLPSSPPLSPSPPDDTHSLILHSRHYSYGFLLEEDVRQVLEDELKGTDVRGGRTEIFSNKECT
ncbi:uncharacterized protein LOC108858986 [Raphanus sativus]|uniref:Uncharacterized protein LOC108858986 n=1 Tax=Raphanus sativus TaxID=3726 RepID=A0A6J0NW07_RAPSA|nr:uncharacterized protein LOC108858986 [Raphanus sativus]